MYVYLFLCIYTSLFMYLWRVCMRACARSHWTPKSATLRTSATALKTAGKRNIMHKHSAKAQQHEKVVKSATA